MGGVSVRCSSVVLRKSRSCDTVTAFVLAPVASTDRQMMPGYK